MKKTKESITFGLDIGTQSAKLVKLRLAEGGAELLGFDIEPSQADLTAALRRLRERQHGMEDVNLSASGPSSVIRYIDFPRMNANELKQALKFEAQKYITFLNSEVNLDAVILRDNLPDNKMLVLLAAVKKDWLAGRLKAIEDAGLHADAVDIDSLALANAFNFNYPYDDKSKDRSIALLNIGAALSNLNILDAGIPHLSRDIHAGGNTLTQRLADMLHMDFKQAEEYKLNPAPDKAEKISLALESVMANLCAEVRTSFDYYESQHAVSVSKIMLSGSGCKFEQIKEMMAGLLGMETQCWDPFKNISLGKGIDADKLKALSPQLAVAVGLALRK